MLNKLTDEGAPVRSRGIGAAAQCFAPEKLKAAGAWGACMNVAIRKAEPGDYRVLMRLYGDFANDPPRFRLGTGDSYAKVLADPSCSMYVAEHDGSIVGFVSFSIRNVVHYPTPICEVEELYVSPKARRNGIATLLLRQAEDTARANSCAYVFIASGNERTEGHALYRARGYDAYGLHFRKKP